MPARIETEAYHAIPPAKTASRHTITAHMPTWALLEEFVSNIPAMLPRFKSMYPRMLPHDDIKKLTGAVLKLAGTDGKACLLFSSLQSASECRDYAISPLRSKPFSDNDKAPPGPPPSPARAEDVTIKAYEAESKFYVVFFPTDKAQVISGFWVHAGVGLSSRQAEDTLKVIEQLHEVDVEDDANQGRAKFNAEPHRALRDRITSLCNRAMLYPDKRTPASSDDVYLFKTGMASIYKLHTYLSKTRNEQSALFGMVFHSTPHVFEEYGQGYKFFGSGTDTELDELEAYLESLSKDGRKLQAVFIEVPTNPNLVSPDLVRLKGLADKYDFVLVVDDTVGSFANIDALCYADVAVTSLTKTFSGYADVIAGSAVLNPSSPRYFELKSLFNKLYVPEFYIEDAKILESNSENYMERTVIFNRNAAALTKYLVSLVNDPSSPVTAVQYPLYLPSGKHYKALMREPTPDFKPGYGCLFSVEFEDMITTRAFYDNMHAHCGPHLGAHLTLVLPYIAAIYANQQKWANKWGLKNEQIRISVGLEDTEHLLEVFKFAVDAATKAKAENKQH